MSTLIRQLLVTYPYARHADPATIERGKIYYKQGRVWDIEMRGDTRAICFVKGVSGDYTVEIEVDKQTEKLSFSCDCPYAENHFCKHMIAAALELSIYLKSDKGLDVEDEEFTARPPSQLAQTRLKPTNSNNWQYKLYTVFLQLPHSPSSGTHTQRFAAVLLMIKGEYYSQYAYSFTPYIIKAKNWDALQKYSTGDIAAVNDLLDTHREWLKHGEDLYSQINPSGCLNLNLEAFNLLGFLQQYSRFVGGTSTFISNLPMLAQFQVPIFMLDKSKKTIQARIQILPQPVEVQVVFTREQGNLVLKAGLKDESILSGTHKADILSSDPPWILMGEKLFRLSNSNYLSVLPLFPITIPEQQADVFREKYLRRMAESFPIQSEFIQWQDIHTNPVPRLYLHDDKDNKLRANLRFGYGDYELDAKKSGDSLAIETLPDSWDLIRVHRQPEQEQTFYQLLADPGTSLKRADTSQPYGAFELRARAHPFDFLMRSIPKLTQVGFEIYGEDNLKLGKINRATPTLRVSITSGIDWFDLKAIVEYGDQQISLHEIRKALKHGENYIKLADGSVGQIPTEWLDKYKHLWNMTNETADGFRVNDFHLPLIDSLLEGDPTIEIPPDLSKRREQLRSFERIMPQPLPRGFIGELRPYQKHGFEWLHFLREYKFGGILADDMGLGKTVQVLVYLQSLREQSLLQGAVLLVVPKSLIVNWQRESEKFTPDLRFLEYMGNLRNKDTSAFNAYDIILTTYGTMLRDVDILKTYKFQYIILDESQAIKNPMAKSTKAARMLDAEHRIVMTGTPVENNTFELWSQFAFLNPGLLGNMDYFKREFANPIESGGDEQTAATLRQLVYPFILRRTKEQVAPELPPRTERVIYTDMDTTQKKLYNQTRERYRAELLGLIESEGMEDARFKILEGLLRLRQIAIHPKLVDKSYKGEAPKFEVLLETLETLQAENHKALIFSQFVETLKLVRQELDARKIKYLYLDGSTTNRQERVDIFQDDPTYPFFLISLKAGGVGLNLTAADYVIHLDPWWNPAVEMQASDRVHRIGQDKPVFIYKIITRGTVEEKILQLQEHKRALVKSLITTESSFFKSLTREDVKVLFD
jgi:non-specific serine/threonine protein kinase